MYLQYPKATTGAQFITRLHWEGISDGILQPGWFYRVVKQPLEKMDADLKGGDVVVLLFPAVGFMQERLSCEDSCNAKSCSGCDWEPFL